MPAVDARPPRAASRSEKKRSKRDAEALERRRRMASSISSSPRAVNRSSASGRGRRVGRVPVADLGPHGLGDADHVVAVVAALGDLGRAAAELDVARRHRLAEQAHLPAEVVDVVLARHAVAGELEDARRASRRRRPGGRGRRAAGPVGLAETNSSRTSCGARPPCPRRRIRPRGDDRAARGREPGGGQRHVEEPGAGHLDAREPGRGGRVVAQPRGDLLGDLARRPARALASAIATGLARSPISGWAGAASGTAGGSAPVTARAAAASAERIS